MFGRYSVAEGSPLRDLVKSTLRNGKGEWSVTVRFSIPVCDYNMLAASWVKLLDGTQEQVSSKEWFEGPYIVLHNNIEGSLSG